MTSRIIESTTSSLPPLVTVSQYLLKRLKEIGVNHIFGVAGDFVLGFLKDIEINKDIEFIPTCNELNAAYAADGYARLQGIGSLTTTFGVGELSALNGVAGSFAERVPVVCITGYPVREALKKQPMLHHTLGDYRIPQRMFKMITCADTILDNPESAADEIDRVLTSCLIYQRPVYIGIPSDVIHLLCNKSPEGDLRLKAKTESDPDTLKECIEDALSLINNSKLPIIIADVEVRRYHLEKQFTRLVEQSGIPFAVTMMGKTVIDEEHSLFVGLYEGDGSRQYVKERVNKSDCVIKLGYTPTDFNTGGFTAKEDTSVSIKVMFNTVQIKNHLYANVSMQDFMEGLAARLKKRDSESMEIHKAFLGCIHRCSEEFVPVKSNKLTISRFFDLISHFIPQNSIVIAETGVALFNAAETLMPSGCTFIGQVFYGSIGYTVGATLGASIACPNRRVILIIGDGSFQVTCQDLSTMIRFGTKPTILLINNNGYTIERAILDGSFNDIQMWKYYLLPEVFGGKKGQVATLEGELQDVLDKLNHKELNFIEIRADKLDYSEPVKIAGRAMANAMKLMEKLPPISKLIPTPDIDIPQKLQPQ